MSTRLHTIAKIARISDIIDIISSPIEPDSIWSRAHKIPWNDPEFSARMLKEHLSQDHQLASRTTEVIAAQCAWIHAHCLGNARADILDLGCGPGLYAPQLAALWHRYTGIDFGPASIAYARQQYGISGQCEFIFGDVLEVDFGMQHDLVMMLYGELNVFSPAHCQRILSKAHAALAPGGTVLIEVQNFECVRSLAQGADTWFHAEAGLFSADPHLCLTQNQWLADATTFVQRFFVLEGDAAGVAMYRSTTKAWTEEEMRTLLQSAGFGEIHRHADWPEAGDGMALLSAGKI